VTTYEVRVDTGAGLKTFTFVGDEELALGLNALDNCQARWDWRIEAILRLAPVEHGVFRLRLTSLEMNRIYKLGDRTRGFHDVSEILGAANA
jgi:hypothetical protein